MIRHAATSFTTPISTQLEFAETVGFDGIGVNEHHANAYGLMQSPTFPLAQIRRLAPACLL